MARCVCIEIGFTNGEKVSRRELAAFRLFLGKSHRWRRKKEDRSTELDFNKFNIRSRKPKRYLIPTSPKNVDS